jgi:hypothetical protein
MKIFLYLILFVAAAPQIALGAESSESCSQEQHVQWLETCLFVIADFTPSEDPLDPWSILRSCSFHPQKALLPEFMAACRARMEQPGRIRESLWQAQPDLLIRLSACSWAAHEQWLGACLRPIDQLKVGGTRSDVLRYFDLERDDGVSESFNSRQCPFVKVNVWFATATGVASGSDKISDIAPYIGYPQDGCR